MKKTLTIILAAVAIVILLADSRTQAQTAAPAGNAQNGKTVYMKIGCWTCHGTVGQGGAAVRIVPPLPVTAFTNYVRKGGPNHSVFGGMPAYSSNAIPDAELADIRAYLASLPAPPPAKTIPLLNQ